MKRKKAKKVKEKPIKSLSIKGLKDKEISLQDGSRLTRDEQIKVIQWLVQLRSYQEIKELIYQEFGKTISRMSIHFYAHSKKWQPIVKRLREYFEKNISKIACANKTDRLRYLQVVIREGLKWSIKNYTKTGKPIYELKLGVVNNAVEAAREEIEGVKGKFITATTIVINFPKLEDGKHSPDRSLYPAAETVN